MRIYVASAFANKKAAAALISQLRRFGHEVTHDWTQESDAGLSPGAREAYLERCASEDMAGVARADALVLLDHPDARAAYCEMGMALATGKPVFADVCLTAQSERGIQIFLRLKSIRGFCSTNELLEQLEDVEEAAMGVWS